MIQPYKKPRPYREMCWMLDNTTVLHESGMDLGLDQIDKEMQVWAAADDVIALLTDGKGEALTWDNKPIRYGPVAGANEWPIRVMRLAAPGDPQMALDGVCEWRDWLQHHGASPAGSLGGSGFSLLKATLDAPLWTSRGELPPIRFTLGGRQEVGTDGVPSVHSGVLQHWDMQAAYARTLGNLRYGGHWERITAPHVLRLTNGANRMLYVRASVRIPDLTWHPQLGPLPERGRTEPNPFVSMILPTQYPTGRTMQGVWTWQELEQAEQHGCRIVRVLDGWLHFAPPDQYPFRPWLSAVEQGRKLRGFAGTLAKATGNATWGQFAIRKTGQRAAVSVQEVNGKHKRVRRPFSDKQRGGGNPSQRAYELAEYICGKVRAELYRGMMQADTSLISAHTDGIWTHGPIQIDGWRMKDQAEHLRLISPQTMAYRSDGASVDTFIVSGVAAQSAQTFFEDEWERTWPHAKST